MIDYVPIMALVVIGIYSLVLSILYLPAFRRLFRRPVPAVQEHPGNLAQRRRRGGRTDRRRRGEEGLPLARERRTASVLDFLAGGHDVGEGPFLYMAPGHATRNPRSNPWTSCHARVTSA